MNRSKPPRVSRPSRAASIRTFSAAYGATDTGHPTHFSIFQRGRCRVIRTSHSFITNLNTSKHHQNMIKTCSTLPECSPSHLSSNCPSAKQIVPSEARRSASRSPNLSKSFWKTTKHIKISQNHSKYVKIKDPLIHLQTAALQVTIYSAIANLSWSTFDDNPTSESKWFRRFRLLKSVLYVWGFDFSCLRYVLFGLVSRYDLRSFQLQKVLYWPAQSSLLDHMPKQIGSSDHTQPNNFSVDLCKCCLCLYHWLKRKVV